MQSVNRQVWGQNFFKGSNFSIKGFSNMWDQISLIYYFTTTVNICYCGIFFWGEHKVSSQNHAAELISQNMFQCCSLCLSNVTRNQCTISLNVLYVFHWWGQSISLDRPMKAPRLQYQVDNFREYPRSFFSVWKPTLDHWLPIDFQPPRCLVVALQRLNWVHLDNKKTVTKR